MSILKNGTGHSIISTLRSEFQCNAMAILRNGL